MYQRNTWTQLSLINDPVVIGLQSAKVYVFSDSVLCLGKVLQHPECNEAWKNRVAGVRAERSYRDFEDVSGKSTEFEWNIFPGFTSLQLCDKISNLLSSLGQSPETFTGRILFMSMFNDISCDRYDNKDECLKNAEFVKTFAKRFGIGQWSFIGPGSEKKWYPSENSPQGAWDRIAEDMLLEFAKSAPPSRCTWLGRMIRRWTRTSNVFNETSLKSMSRGGVREVHVWCLYEHTSYDASQWVELKCAMCQILRMQYAVELETLLMARMEPKSEYTAMVKTWNECQHADYMSVHGKKSIARKCCSKPSFFWCCCSTRCLQSLSSTRWLWYGLGNGARGARRVSRDVTPHRLNAYSTRLVITARPWIAVCIKPWEWKPHSAPSMNWLRSILCVVVDSCQMYILRC